MRTAFLILFFLAGCASPGETPESGWNGATYDEVVRAWGAPTRSTQLSDGSNVYTWVSEGAGTRGRVSPSIGARSAGGSAR